ncbi:MAG: hypothetical protein Q9174_002728 [Haloplaca sp. 1 TL-2023]
MQHLVLVGSVLEEQTVVSQIDLFGVAESAANTFFWKYEKDAPARCAIIDGIVKAVIMGAFMFLAALVPGAAPAAAGVVPALAAAGSSATLSISGGEFAKWAFNFAGIATNNAGGDAIDRATPCDWPSAPEGLEKEARQELQRQITEFHVLYRKQVEGGNEQVLKGLPVQGD